MEKSIKGTYLLIGLLLVAMFTIQITNHKFEYYKERFGDYQSIPVKVIEQRLNCLALNIYREAGHEPFEGKEAVS